MTFKVKEGVQVGSTLALDANGKLTTGLSTGRSISLTGDVAGSATFDGTANISIATTVQPNSVALGTDTTGNYMVNVLGGTGVSVSHTQSEGSTATVSIGQPVATTDNVTFANINASGNLVIDGNLTVNGTTTTISASNLAIEDNLIYLNEGSTVANPDLGITGNYNDGTYAHTGVFRDATDNRWKFFKGYTPEPSTSIDTTHASFAYADVQAGTFYGALSGNASTASTWQTARTLTIGSTGKSVNGSANVSWSLAEIGAAASTHYHDRIYNGASGSSSYLALSSTNELEYYNASGVIDTLYLQYSGTAAQLKGPGGAQIWMDSNDGSGSGLDADLLDGNHASAFALAGHTHSYLSAESDTLATVTGRGASTSTTVALNGGAGLGDGWLYFNDTDRNPGSATYYPNVQTRAVRFAFIGASYAGTGGNYAGMMQFNPWTGTTASTGDASYQFVFGSTAANSGGIPQLRIRKGIDTTWNSWYEIYHSGNLTNLNQLTNGPGYITGESDTLATVTGRGATTSTLSTFSGGIVASAGIYGAGSGAPDVPIWMVSTANPTWGIFYNEGTPDYIEFKAGGSVTSVIELDNGSHRAPIFYDYNDTTYYIDPNNTGTSYRGRGEILLGPNTSGRYTRFGGNGGATDEATVSASNGNLHIDSKAGYGLYLNHYSSGDIISNNGGGVFYNYTSVRSPIFYDYNDTNYYLDAASTSSILRTYIKGYNNTGYIAFNNAGTYWGLIGNYGTNDWRLGWGDVGGLTGWGVRWDASGNAWSNASHRAPIFYDNDDTGYYLDPNSYSRIRQLTVTNARVDSSKYPIGHYAPGQEVFAIDPTWTQDQLREYFNTSNVSWVADSSAPGGYAIQISGSTSIGGNSYGSGFPWIPVESDDTFYMECYIKDVSGTNGHYMGSIDFDHNFSNLGGNPGSYGYWVMANQYPGASWTKVSGYISGFGTSTGQFKIGTKYWTPQALFNYSGGGTSYISGWRVYRLAKGIVGRFPNSTTNSGEAWYGRANDRNRGTFTIQLGGGSSSGRTFEVVDYAWSSVMFSVDSGNYASAAGSFRAPIFYDSNNTGYYVDPNSVSVLNDTRLCAGNTQIVTNNVGNNTKWRALAGSSDLGISFYDAGDNWRMQLYASSGNYGFLNGNWASWDFRKVPSGALYLNNQSTYYYTHDTTYVYRVYGTADIRSPIFYDNDNTGYYVDPASTTYINVLTTAGNITSNSDIRLKRDIQKITNATDKVKKLNGVTFTRIDVEDTTKRYAGLIAQEVLEVLPEAVEGTATYSVAYGNMVGLLVEAIKEQQSEIDELKALVKQLLAK